MSGETDNAGAGAVGKAPAERTTFVTVLRNSNFRNLWVGQTISQVGDYFAFLALMVVVSGFSQDTAVVTASVSGVMIAITLPRLLFGVLAGVFVDRWDRRRTMLASDLIRAALTLLMIPAFLSRNLWLMYALAFAMSAIGTLFFPARGALVPKLVKQEELTSANSLLQTSMMLGNFIGPALAGAAFTAAGRGNEWIAFVIDSASFLASAVAIWLIRMPVNLTTPIASAPITDVAGVGGTPPDSAGALHRVWGELVVGVKVLFFNRTMAMLAAAFAITMLGIGAVNVLWVAFLKINFGFDSVELAQRLSILDIGFFAGMVGASILVGNFLSHLAPKWFIVWGLLIAGLATSILGYLPDYWLVVLVSVVMGAFVGPINTGVSTLMQIVVPNNQLGRVGGGLGTVIDTASLASMSLAGVLGALLGVPVVFLLGGLLCMAGGVLAWATLPTLTLKDMPEEAPRAESGLPLQHELALHVGLSPESHAPPAEAEALK
jgi:MFS family permease